MTKNQSSYLKFMLPVMFLVIGVFLTMLVYTFLIDRSPETGSADAGFARDMATHHKQAVDMSFTIRNKSTDEDVRTLAYDIANTQSTQAGMLMGWLQQWGLPQASSEKPMTWMSSGSSMGHSSMGHNSNQPNLMPGMATPAEIEKLKALSGPEADIMFLQLMIRHHMGGVSMAKGILERSNRPEVRQLARTIVDGQQAEMDLMKEMLKERGANNN